MRRLLALTSLLLILSAAVSAQERTFSVTFDDVSFVGAMRAGIAVASIQGKAVRGQRTRERPGKRTVVTILSGVPEDIQQSCLLLASVLEGATPATRRSLRLTISGLKNFSIIGRVRFYMFAEAADGAGCFLSRERPRQRR